MEGQSKEPRRLEACCRGSQGPPRAVAPLGRKEVTKTKRFIIVFTTRHGRVVQFTTLQPTTPKRHFTLKNLKCCLSWKKFFKEYKRTKWYRL
jgi:hypothetical protein